MAVLQFKPANNCASDRGPVSILPFPLARYPGLIDRWVREAKSFAEPNQRNAAIVGHITVEFNRLIDIGVSVDEGSRAVTNLAKAIGAALCANGEGPAA
jgi:hypothetical protein